jgi:hypothetical protein
MPKPNAIAELHLFSEQEGGYRSSLGASARLLAWVGPVYGKIAYGLVVLETPGKSHLMPGETATVEVMFFEDVGARREIPEGAWVPVGEPGHQRGRLRVVRYLA